MPVTTEHMERIYRYFLKAQADYNNRGYRMTKDFDNHFNTKFKEVNKKALIKITGWFLTKWSNIDPYEYFNCGFELLGKGFTYVRFFNPKIIKLYKTRDKIKKREIEITKKGLVKSALFVKKWMNKNNATLYDYINKRDGNQRIAVDHYFKNYIDASFFVYLIKRGMILTDNERAEVPYIQNKYRDILFELNRIQGFLTKLGEKL